jgi:hypothetical protein
MASQAQSWPLIALTSSTNSQLLKALSCLYACTTVQCSALHKDAHGPHKHSQSQTTSRHPQTPYDYIHKHTYGLNKESYFLNNTTTSQNIYFRFHNIYNNRYDKFFEAWMVNALFETFA